MSKVNNIQKSKRTFRKSKKWKDFRKTMKERCEKLDVITQKKLYRNWQLHHRNLNEKNYQNLQSDWFLCCNNLTHKVIHWLWTYYQKDESIINRLKFEMEKMKEINLGGGNE